MSVLDRIIKGKKATRVGIDISSTTVKLLELSESNEGFRVEAYSVSSLPHGAVYEKNINNVGEVATAIQSVMHQSRTRATEVVTAVSGSSVINKIIAMPAGLTDDEMETQLALASASWVSISSSVRPAGMAIILLMTDDPETAVTTSVARVRL